MRQRAIDERGRWAAERGLVAIRREGRLRCGATPHDHERAQDEKQCAPGHDLRPEREPAEPRRAHCCERKAGKGEPAAPGEDEMPAFAKQTRTEIADEDCDEQPPRVLAA